MKNHRAPLLLGLAMIGIALLAVFDVVPEKVAQFAPLALLVLFPQAWLGRDRSCTLTKRRAA